MKNIIELRCPRRSNNHNFYHYGKDKDGYQNIFAVIAAINLLPYSIISN